MNFLKAIGAIVLALFVFTVISCGLASQKPACPDGYDFNTQGCKGMPRVGTSSDTSGDG